MEETIRGLAEQFDFEPVMQNENGFRNSLQSAERFVVCGMGGSHLAAGLLRVNNPALDIYVHNDYGLPAFVEKFLEKAGRSNAVVFVASSYSGNTEEVLDFAEKAHRKDLKIVSIASGGRLIEWAKGNNLPFIELPAGISVGRTAEISPSEPLKPIQPRNALGFSVLAMASIIDPSALPALKVLSKNFDAGEFETAGRTLGDTLRERMPIIYSSRQNFPIAYNWKIKFNETAKIPAFCNVFPELNHNEMNGFDFSAMSSGASAAKNLFSGNFHVIFLRDADDHPQIARRMDVCREMYEARQLPVTEIPLNGANSFAKIFNSLALADWAALALAEFYGHDPQNVPMIEEFKKKIAG